MNEVRVVFLFHSFLLFKSECYTQQESECKREGIEGRKREGIEGREREERKKSLTCVRCQESFEERVSLTLSGN